MTNSINMKSISQVDKYANIYFDSLYLFKFAWSHLDEIV